MEFEYQWNTWGSAQWRWYAPVALIVLLAAGGIIAYGVMAGYTVWMLGPVLSAVFTLVSISARIWGWALVFAFLVLLFPAALALQGINW